MRTLQERINSMLYERSALSHKPEETTRHDQAQLRQQQRVQPDLLLKDRRGNPAGLRGGLGCNRTCCSKIPMYLIF